MKQSILYFLIICICGCSNPESKKDVKIIKDTLTKVNYDTAKLTFIHLDKLFLTGDFDGNGKIDSLTQNIISKLTYTSIDSIPEIWEWHQRSRFFDSIQSDVILSSRGLRCDTLHFLYAGGLYCLINIGDNNLDGKDEIALVVEHSDFSRVNTCYIYTICNNKFIELTYFHINERSFDYDGDTKPDFKEIKGSLERRNKKWVFIDYYKWWEGREAKDTVLRTLKLKKGC